MVTRNANVPADKRIIFRVGINLGDVIAEKGDLFGEGVNIAARLESLSEPGGIAISRTVRDQIRDRLPIAFVDAGEHEVKNIARPVRVYALSAEAVGKLDAETASKASERRPSRLQVAVAGVAAAIAAVARFAYPHLSAPSLVRVTTIQGPTVAVLPFDNLTGDPAQASFADGLSEELISDLSGFKELRVLARNTTFTYKGKAVDVPEVGRKLECELCRRGQRPPYRQSDQGDGAAYRKRPAGTMSGRKTMSVRRATTNLLALQEEIAGKDQRLPWRNGWALSPRPNCSGPVQSP